MESLSQKNSEMMSLLSNDDTENNPPISEERQAREINMPYPEEPELTHRDVNLPNGNIIRIRKNKIKS